MKTLACIFFAFISWCSNAQNGIEYSFPKKIEESLKVFFEKKTKGDFFLVLDKQRENEYLLTIGSLNGESNDLLVKSNRYSKIDQKIIPVILSTDYAFISYGKGPNGQPIRHTVINEGYTIKFTYYGAILKEGY